MIQDSPHTVTSGLSNSATAKQSHYKPEILVVDAYSTDNTTELASRAGATVIQQPTQIYPAKALAMRAGLEESIRKS
jgi:glycosyltransferase involved in cell wall biosynthesis